MYLAKQGFNGSIWGSDDLLDKPIASAISENGSNLFLYHKKKKLFPLRIYVDIAFYALYKTILLSIVFHFL